VNPFTGYLGRIARAKAPGRDGGHVQRGTVNLMSIGFRWLPPHIPKNTFQLMKSAFHGNGNYQPKRMPIANI